MAIGLASYLAVSGQSMKLSNRSYAKDVSRHLAEKGIEVALLALRTNNWDDWTANSTSADWTLSGTTATCTITYPTNSYGTSGLTATTKIRVDNYNAYNLPAEWYSGSARYRVNDLVGKDGTWYRCVQVNTSAAANQPPNLNFWAPAPIPWSWSSNTDYVTSSATSNSSMIFNGTIWYRCAATHTSPNTIPTLGLPNWTALTATTQTPSLAWASGVTYTNGQFVYRAADNTWYRCTSTHVSTASFNAAKFSSTTSPYIAWRWRDGVAYKFNDVIYYNSTWYRCIAAHTVSGSVPLPTDTGYWENALTASSGWSANFSYNLGDAVYYSADSKWYRCTRAHTSTATLTPTNSTYWNTSPLYSTYWDPTRRYRQFDTVYYRGNWYLSYSASNNNGNYPTAVSSAFWAIAPRTLTAWDSGKNYSIDDIVSSGGSWYRCKKDTTANEATSSGTYWDALTGATGTYAPWSASSTYASGNYVSYGGGWYKCIQAPTANQTPNDANYWSAAWANTWGITTGATVIYSEGAANIPLQVTSASTQQLATIKTQLRATVSQAPLFPNAIAASDTLTIGGGGTVDSYDSVTDSAAGTLGYSATLASKYTASTAVQTGSTDVKGYLAAPSDTTTYAPRTLTGGTVKGAATPLATSVDLTRISRSPFIPQFDSLPAGGLATDWGTVPKGTLLSLSTTTNIGTPGATTPSRYYINGDLAIGGTAAVSTLNINGPVILYINGNLTMAGTPNGTIYINSAGSAEIHIAGGLQVDVGSQGIVNRTLNPTSLALICDTTSNLAQFFNEGANVLHGVVYVPNTTNSNGFYFDNTSTTLLGAISAKIVRFNNNANVHYDTSLRYATFQGIDTPFQIDQWRELTDPTERAVLP